MSFRAVTEAVVHFETFRNVDLFHQGIYFLRTSLYYQKEQTSSQVYYAQPYTVFTPKVGSGGGTQANHGSSQTVNGKQRKKRNLDHHNIIPAQIDKGMFTFNTRAFMIRYCEEEVELNDIGHFRIELDLEDGQPSKTEFFMEVELMFSDLLNQGGPEKFQQQSNLKEIEGNAEFKCVSVQKYRIRKLSEGIFEYVPIVFDEQHFCIALCTIHSSLLDFRFRLRPLKPFSRSEYMRASEKQDTAAANQKSVAQGGSLPFEWKPNNAGEYLFSNDQGEVADDIDPQEVDQIYNGYMQALIGSYDKLKGRFNTFAAKCLSEKQKRESGLLLVAPPIQLPGDKELIEQELRENQQQQQPILQEESKRSHAMSASPMMANRMGAKQGARMERVQKKDQQETIHRVDVMAAHDQTVRGEEHDDEAVIHIDDDDDDDPVNVMDEDYTNRRGNLNPPKALIDREPEMEPELAENPQKKKQYGSHPQKIGGTGNSHNRVLEQDDPPEEDDEQQKPSYEEEGSLNISESNDSMHEIKKVTAIPILKNNDKFKNKISKETSLQSDPLAMNKFNSRRKSNSIIPFSQRVVLQDPYQIAFQLMQDLNQVGSQLLQLWHKIIEIITINPKFICEFLRIQFEEKMREVQGEHIYRTLIETKDFAIPSDENVGEIHKQIATKRRSGLAAVQNAAANSGAQLIMQSAAYDVFNVIEAGGASTGQTQAQIQGPLGANPIAAQEAQPQQTLQQALIMNDLQPILFEEVYVKSVDKIKQLANAQQSQQLTQNGEQSSTQINEYNYRGVHLFVMVHGFQGNSCDMRLLKNNIALLFPEAMFLCSSSNEEYTEGDILEMGVRLSQEVSAYINQYCPGSTLGRISFIAHSLGGLIVRASLPYLEEHKDKMYNLFTLSSPHLGYMFNQSKIIDAGMWFLKTWRKSKCLQQLRMSDASNLEESALYKLSELPGLNWFKHIVLVSSYQDSYAPFDSARIQICTKATNDASRGNIYIKMARNLLSGLPLDVLYRIDVDFRIAEKNLDSFIGRTAHIQFLECQNVMKMLIYRFKEFFC